MAYNNYVQRALPLFAINFQRDHLHYREKITRGAVERITDGPTNIFLAMPTVMCAIILGWQPQPLTLDHQDLVCICFPLTHKFGSKHVSGSSMI
jgi:hypothetical protein